MIDLHISDHLSAIGDWVGGDTEKRSCLLFVAEKADEPNGAFCGLLVNGEELINNLAAIMLEHPQLYTIMTEACAMTMAVWDSTEDDKQ